MTKLERVAKVIRDLKTVGVMVQEDGIGFLLTKGEPPYFLVEVGIYETKKNAEPILETIKYCFEKEFRGEEISESSINISKKRDEYSIFTCHISAE